MGITVRSEFTSRITVCVLNGTVAAVILYLFLSLPTQQTVFIDQRIAPAVARTIQDLVLQKKDILKSEISIIEGYSRDQRNPLLHIIGVRARIPHVTTNQQMVVTCDGFLVPKKEYTSTALEHNSEIYVEKASLMKSREFINFARTISNDFCKKNKVLWKSASDIVVHENSTGYIYRVTAQNYRPTGLGYLAGYKNKPKSSFFIDTRFNDMVVIAGVGTHGNAVA